MKFEIHHYYHVGAGDLKILTQITSQLNQISEKLNFMSENTATRQELDSAVEAVVAAVTNGFASLSVSITKELTEVAEALGNKSGQRDDLTPEVAKLRGLAATIEDKFADATAAVQSIVVPQSAPAGDPVVDTAQEPFKDPSELPTDELTPPVGADAGSEDLGTTSNATGESSSDGEEEAPAT